MQGDSAARVRNAPVDKFRETLHREVALAVSQGGNVYQLRVTASDAGLDHDDVTAIMRAAEDGRGLPADPSLVLHRLNEPKPKTKGARREHRLATATEIVKQTATGTVTREQAAAMIPQDASRGDLLALHREMKRASREIITKDRDGLVTALEGLGYEWRYNIRQQRFEVRHDGDSWQEVGDRKEAWLQTEIEEQYGFVAGKETKAGTPTNPAHFGRTLWQQYSLTLAHEAEVDPFLEWLHELPKWDGIKRLHSWLTEVFDIEPSEHESTEGYVDLLAWASAAAPLGAVYRAFKPGFKIDTMVVLIGNTSIGKDTAWEHLLPADQRGDWFGVNLHLADDPKRRVEALQGKVIVEASEMAGATRADLESLKTFLTACNDGGVRLSYRRNPESMPRRCVIVGTSNEDRPLPNDPTGNRRFVPLKVNSKPAGVQGLRKYLKENRLQLWAEAVWCYDNGEGQPWLPDHLATVQFAVNEGHRRDDEALEDQLHAWLDAPGAPVEFTMKRAAAEVSMISTEEDAAKLSHREVARLSRALRNMGYVSRQLRRGAGKIRFWELDVPRDTSGQKTE